MSDDLRQKFKEILEHPTFAGTDSIQSNIIPQPTQQTTQQTPQQKQTSSSLFTYVVIGIVAALLFFGISMYFSQSQTTNLNVKDLENSIDELLEEEDDEDNRIEEIQEEIEDNGSSVYSKDPLFQPLQ